MFSSNLFINWLKFSLGSVLILNLYALQVVRVQAAEAPSVGSGMDEATLAGLVTQLSDSLATKIKASSCAEMVTLLDQTKASSSKPMDSDSVITRVLNDVKTNPKLKAIIIQKLSEPLLSRMLECNMVPLDVLTPSATPK